MPNSTKNGSWSVSVQPLYIVSWNGNGSGNFPGAVLSYLRNLNAESLHFPAKLVRVAVEDDARHTGALGAFDVLSGIVDKQTFPGNKTERLVQSIGRFPRRA